MIEYFIRPMSGISSSIGRSDHRGVLPFGAHGFRRKPAGVVTGPLGEGSLNLLADCARAAAVAGGDFKFTVTSPYMKPRTLLDHHYGSFEELTLALAEVLAAQMAGLPAACIQVDEANIPGNPKDGPMAAASINVVLDAISRGTERAVHFCFGNYGGQTIQKGNWKALPGIPLRLAYRPPGPRTRTSPMQAISMSSSTSTSGSPSASGSSTSR